MNVVNADFNSRAVDQGVRFEYAVFRLLEKVGFQDIRQHERLEGTEVDFIVRNKNGIDLFITAKGSDHPKYPGCVKTDTLKKAITDCLYIYLNTNCPGIIITSHRPVDGRGLKMIGPIMPRSILFDILEFRTARERLMWLLKATHEDLDNELSRPRP